MSSSMAKLAEEPSALQPDLRRIRASLQGHVRRICPDWLADQAEDIVQEALLRVLGAFERGDGREIPNSYLRKTAYCAMIDEIRAARRRREQLAWSEDSGRDRSDSLGGQRDPEGDAGRAELGAAIVDCIGRLVESRRLALTLYLYGHTVPETADLLGWTVKKAENAVFRGRINLRRCLETKGWKP